MCFQLFCVFVSKATHSVSVKTRNFRGSCFSRYRDIRRGGKMHRYYIWQLAVRARYMPKLLKSAEWWYTWIPKCQVTVVYWNAMYMTNTQATSCNSNQIIHYQEVQLSPRDRTMRRVSWNLANCHTSVQKLLVRQILNKSKLWSWRVTVGKCVINMCTQPWPDRVASTVL